MQVKIILFLVAATIGLGAKAQQNKFTVGLGYQRTWMLDKQASPLKYQTSEKTVLLSYEKKGGKGIFNAQLNGAIGSFFPTGYKNRLMYDAGYHDDGTPKKRFIYHISFHIFHLSWMMNKSPLFDKGKLLNRGFNLEVQPFDITPDSWVQKSRTRSAATGSRGKESTVYCFIGR